VHGSAAVACPGSLWRLSRVRGPDPVGQATFPRLAVSMVMVRTGIDVPGTSEPPAFLQLIASYALAPRRNGTICAPAAVVPEVTALRSTRTSVVRTLRAEWPTWL
jgi:hypothetical protein